MLPLPKKLYHVAVVLFKHADILDFSGPIGFLTHMRYTNGNPAGFQTHIIGNSAVELVT